MKKDKIIIFASSSLKNPLTKICNNYKAETGKKAECTFNSSGRLREKIESGFYADIYFSASFMEVNKLKHRNLLYNDTITNILGNKIVLVVPKNSNIDIKSFSDLAKDSVKQIAIGESITSPVGRYTEELLNNLGIYGMIADKIIFGHDSKEIIDLVKVDKLDCAIVYKTEVVLDNNDLKIAAEADGNNHTEIIYSTAVLKDTEKEEDAREFMNYLCSDKSLSILEDYGFDIII